MNFNLLLRIPVMRANRGIKIFTRIFFGMGPLVSPLVIDLILKYSDPNNFEYFIRRTGHVTRSRTRLISQVWYFQVVLPSYLVSGALLSEIIYLTMSNSQVIYCEDNSYDSKAQIV